MVRSTVRYVKEKVLVLRKTLNAAPHLDSTNQEARCLEKLPGKESMVQYYREYT